MDIHQAYVALGLPQQAKHIEAKAAYLALVRLCQSHAGRDAQASERMKRIQVAYALVCQQLDARQAKAARPACVQRTVRVSLHEAAFGCSKRVQGKPVDSCKSLGRLGRFAWALDITIHPGTLDGMVVQPQDIRVRYGAEALPSNLRLTIQLEKHPLFQLEQDRLRVRVPVSVWRWALGGDITVPTLDGSVQLALLPTPAEMLVKEKGWPVYGTPKERHPLIVEPRIVYPQALRADEMHILQLLDASKQLPEVRGWNCNVQAWVESFASGVR